MSNTKCLLGEENSWEYLSHHVNNQSQSELNEYMLFIYCIYAQVTM